MLPFNDPWFAYGVPLGALAFAGISYALLWLQDKRLDRRFGPDPK